ncbi:MAG: hypothetical protein ACRDNJ_08910 [Solirubrobacteraceae bacterium]
MNTAKTLPATRSALTVAGALVLLAGCGGGLGRPAHRPATSGRAVFATSCSACHSLNGRYKAGLMGGDLLRLHASRAQLTQFAAEMPVHPALNASRLRAVVSYVMDAERHAAR